MKKFLLLILVLLSLQVSVFASTFIGNMFDIVNAVNETSQGIKKISNDRKEVQHIYDQDFSLLSLEERQAYFEENKTKYFAPSMANLFLGFGSGNKMVNDTFGYNFFSIVDGTILGIGGGVVVGTLLVPVCGAVIIPLVLKDPDYFEKAYSDIMPIVGSTLLITGGALAVSHALSFLTTFPASARFNRKLKNSLDLNNLQLAVLPNFNGGITIGGTISLS